jgi:hypothetical protein
MITGASFMAAGAKLVESRQDATTPRRQKKGEASTHPAPCLLAAWRLGVLAITAL